MKFALFKLYVEVVFCKALEDCMNMRNMLFQVGGVDQDVIYVGYDKFMEHVSEQLIYEWLEDCRGISKSIWHDKVFIMLVSSMEHCLTSTSPAASGVFYVEKYGGPSTLHQLPRSEHYHSPLSISPSLSSCGPRAVTWGKSIHQVRPVQCIQLYPDKRGWWIEYCSYNFCVLSRLKAQMVCGKLLLILCFVFQWAKVLPWWLHRKEPILGWLWYFTIFLGDRLGSSVWMVCSTDCATFGRVYLSCFVLFPNQTMMLPVWILLMVQVKKFISTLKGILKSLKYIK